MHAGTARARELLYAVPNTFYDFSRMDQFTFERLADWCLANAMSYTPQDISVEEELLIFIDIVGQGSHLSEVALHWGHDLDLTKRIFWDIWNALQLLKEQQERFPTCPKFKSTQNRWRALKTMKSSKRSVEHVRLGLDYGDAYIEVNKEELVEVLTTLNHFIHEHKEF